MGLCSVWHENKAGQRLKYANPGQQLDYFMANIDTAAPAPKRGFRWLRFLLFTVLGLVVLLAIAYFVLTSAFFLKGVILPKVSKAMNANITVQDASIGMSGVTLKSLRVQTTGTEPLLSADEARVRYSLSDIIGGKITVPEVLLQSPSILIVYNPDGTSNLDPFVKPQQAGQPTAQPAAKPSEAPKPAETQKPSAQKPSKPLQINVKQVDIKNATVRMIKNYNGGLRDFTSVSNFNFSLQNLANGQTGKLTIAANLGLDNNPPAPGTNGVLQAALATDFSFTLTPDLKPDVLKGSTKITVDKAAGAFADASGVAVTVNADTSPTEIKDLSVRVQKSGALLSQLAVNGPFNVMQTEGRLNVQASIDQQLLNLVGAKTGMNFNQTAISSQTQVTLTNRGKLITLAGQLNMQNFSVTQTNQTTPPLDLKAVYNLTVDQLASSALISQFTVNGAQKQREFLAAELSNPMKIAWGKNTQTAGDATLNAKITDFDFAEWKVFLGNVAPAGKLNATAKLVSQQGGNLLNLDLTTQVDALTAKMGSNFVNQLAASFMTKATVTNLKKIVLNDLRTQVSQQNDTMAAVTANGTVDLLTTNIDLNIGVQAALPRTMQVLAMKDLSASSGKVDVKAKVLQDPTSQTVTGNLALSDFTGKMGGSQFDNYNTTADLDLSMKDKMLTIRKLNTALQAGGNAGGTIALSGNVNTTNTTGEFSIKLADLNQNALKPFLQASLGDKKLVSVLLNGTATASVRNFSGPSSLADAGAGIKAEIVMTNLVVSDPKKSVPETPLYARLGIDGDMRNKILDLRSLGVGLTPTAKAKNEIQLAGKVDMTDNNAMTGAMKLTADALDLTAYYDLFGAKSAAKPEAAKPAGTAPQPKPAETVASTQPATSTPAAPAAAAAQKPLPFRNFTFDANIGHIYLRAIEVAALQTSVKLDTNRIVVQPLQLTVNDAPLKSTVDLNLAVPGCQYDIAFNADKLQLAPFVDTFMPDKKGLYQGQVLADLKLKGIGATGASLQKSLNGNVLFVLTNGNFQILDPVFQKYLGPLATFLKPVATFLQVPEVVNSPLQEITLATQMGQGNIQMSNLTVSSTAFVLNTAGTMPITEPLTNSPFQNWPVNFSLSRNLSQKIGYMPAGTPADAKFVKLPSFLSVGGTLGKPDPQINKMAIVGTAIEKYLPKVPGLNQGTTSLLQGFGVLPGSNTNAAAGTNKPAGGIGNVIQGIFSKPPAATNAPGAANTNTPAKPGLLDIFKR